LAIALASVLGRQEKAAQEHVVVPPKVIIAFTKTFPKASHVKWSKEKNDYEASFHFKGKKESAVFHREGKLMETEVEIAANELPKAVVDYVSKKYPKKKIDEAAKITGIDGNVMFEAEVGGKDLIFDASGKLQTKEK